jgi:deazaflavin-dependent oxidoreductase (nitroreductase family)
MGKRFWLFVSVAAIVGATTVVRSLFVREAGRRLLFPLLRPLYQHVFNPGALRAAARGETRWGVLHHVGRRSGTAYDTPIDAQRTPDGVVICLVYGQSADWCRNVLAAGGCSLSLDREELTLSAPRVVPLSSVEAQIMPERARLWRGIGIEHCLVLTTSAPASLETA